MKKFEVLEKLNELKENFFLIVEENEEIRVYRAFKTNSFCGGDGKNSNKCDCWELCSRGFVDVCI